MGDKVEEKEVPSQKLCNYKSCNKYKRSKGFCVKHGGGKRCKEPDCNTSTAGTSIYCAAHGGGLKCKFSRCTKHVVSKGLCVQHGGGRQCSIDGCTKHAQSGTGRQFCIAHGGGVRCKFPGCQFSAAKVGDSLLCRTHGGGFRCVISGCRKSSKIKGGLCINHGGGVRCKIKGCTASARNHTTLLCFKHGGGNSFKIVSNDTASYMFSDRNVSLEPSLTIPFDDSKYEESMDLRKVIQTDNEKERWCGHGDGNLKSNKLFRTNELKGQTNPLQVRLVEKGFMKDCHNQVDHLSNSLKMTHGSQQLKGRKRCIHANCTKFAVTQSKNCMRHGGGRRCKTRGCTMMARKKGMCATHLM